MKKEIKAFGNIELSKKLLAAVSDMGFEEPSPTHQQLSLAQNQNHQNQSQCRYE